MRSAEWAGEGGWQRGSERDGERASKADEADKFLERKTRNGKFLLRRKTRRKRMKAKLKEVKDGLRERRHAPVAEATAGGWAKWCAAISPTTRFPPMPRPSPLSGTTSKGSGCKP